MKMSLHFHKSQCHYYFNALVPGQLGTGSSRNEKSQKRSAQILGMERPLNNDCCPKAGSRVFNVSFGKLIKLALYSFFCRARNSYEWRERQSISILVTSLKTRVFEWSKNAYCARSRRWIFLTIGTWIEFFFLSLLGKNHQILHLH